ncbi:MAG: hypothetical protein ACFHVJ_02540 [Aestuariibacter sp.]
MNRRKPKKITRKTLFRSVASSTAIETGESVESIERKLKRNRNKYRELALAV